MCQFLGPPPTKNNTENRRLRFSASFSFQHTNMGVHAYLRGKQEVLWTRWEVSPKPSGLGIQQASGLLPFGPGHVPFKANGKTTTGGWCPVPPGAPLFSWRRRRPTGLYNHGFGRPYFMVASHLAKSRPSVEVSDRTKSDQPRKVPKAWPFSATQFGLGQ